MSIEAASALRQRMIEDMNARKLCAGTQRDHMRLAASPRKRPVTGNNAFRRHGPRLFSNSGREVKLSANILAGSIVLSAVGACPPHDGVG